MPRLVNSRCKGGSVVDGVKHHRRFLAKARPEWDLRYLSNASALYLSGKAQYQTNSQGLNLAVCVDLPELWSEIRRFKSAVSPGFFFFGEQIFGVVETHPQRAYP